MMRADYDAATKWSPIPDWRDAEIAREGWTARPELGLHMLLVSGEMARLDGVLPLPEAGLWAVEAAGRLRLRGARDRALLVSVEALPLGTGWRAGLAVSDASCAFAVFELAGSAMRAVVAEAVSADLDAGRASAATLFAGIPAFLYRTAPETARLLVDAPLAAYAWRWLETRT